MELKRTLNDSGTGFTGSVQEKFDEARIWNITLYKSPSFCMMYDGTSIIDYWLYGVKKYEGL